MFRMVLAAIALVMPNYALPVAIAEIKDASAEARAALASAAASSSSTSQPSTVPLEAKFKRREGIVHTLQSEVNSFKAERAQLVQVQTALTSGLIGAIVTALVAIGGAILNSKSSKPD